MAKLVKNAVWETWVQSLGWEGSAGEGKGYPLQYSGLENSMDYSPWGRKELDTTEQLSLSLLCMCVYIPLSHMCIYIFILFYSLSPPFLAPLLSHGSPSLWKESLLRISSIFFFFFNSIFFTSFFPIELTVY